ncbi:unnamed protein product [Rotaria socialis]|nr:unnamed protein product [Rotaria socialis]CAF3468605.1 unnamed protein product [Rotaria socialis]CAF4457159.1 unnamed protein product [Rotaria socialis]CAF4495225.1 unnamed protein product [Rotaria socialis]CAF4613868.1 unnamed protein product [Rotaria socialis]
MFMIKIWMFLLIPLISVDGRALRKQRQTMTNTLGQDTNNFFSNGYNVIRDSVVPVISSNVNQFSQNWDRYKENFGQGINQISQNWDRYKQNFNQGLNQITQGWNQFTQNFIPQYPYRNNNYAYNRDRYGYNNQQYPYSMNYNYNFPSNMYQNNLGRNENPYAANNYANSIGSPRENVPYYSSNSGRQWYQNLNGQQRFNGPIASNAMVYTDQRTGFRRR